MVRFVLGAIRSAAEPITSLEIAKAVIEGRGLDPADERTVILFRKRVGRVSNKLKAKGAVREVSGVGPYKYWEAAD
jgi:hypothetical protein